KTNEIGPARKPRSNSQPGTRCRAQDKSVFISRMPASDAAQKFGLTAAPKWQNRLADTATRRLTEGSPRDVRGFGSCERQHIWESSRLPFRSPRTTGAIVSGKTPGSGPRLPARSRRILK